ncbi:hypothetical protein ASD62_16505 [Phycicoccus sp. Root563]|uniref:DUF2304 domain-containing protein n=1 Tax=Phycicoccus sp. Root563 TaxID=1736562 RepID=UPI000702CC4E|nr:DUF2304 domain-containing protein [Phycicoccus sp. Root563]KQZ90650.1 hypothetical protein ASD62_16505 [Phycicoccus sp. Root563]
MTHDAYWLGVAGGLLIVLVIVEMVRRRYLRGRYALVWVVLGTGAATLALFPNLLGRAATALGVTVPFNLLLFLGMLVMLVMIMQLSSEAGRLQERTRVLAEEVALLKTAVDQLSRRDASAAASDSPKAESVRAT